MLSETLNRRLDASEKYFQRSTSCLTEEHSTFKPEEEQMTVAQQVAHVAQTVDWFLAGAFGDGFDMDFEAQAAEVARFDSLAAARDELAAAFARAREALAARNDAELEATLPEGPVMGGAPRTAIVGAMEEHTAHHRGALTVYSRLLGLVPPMPYM